MHYTFLSFKHKQAPCIALHFAGLELYFLQAAAEAAPDYDGEAVHQLRSQLTEVVQRSAAAEAASMKAVQVSKRRLCDQSAIKPLQGR